MSSREELARLYREMERRLCLKSLTYLMENVLDYRNLAPMHSDMEQELEEVRTGKRRGLFLLPRGHLKSTTITISYVIQRILQNPNIRILISNALLDNSKGFLREIKSHFERNEKFRELFGTGWIDDDSKWSEMQIIVGKRTKYLKEPTIQVTSVDKSVVSQHYDLIVADDLVNRESITTKEQREKLVKYYKDLLDLLEPDGELLVIGTRWHYDDLYGYLIEKNRVNREFRTMVRKVYADDERKQVIFPQKYSLKYIRGLRESKGAYEFSCQYLNEPVEDEDADFKREFFQFFNLQDLDLSVGDVYITVDPAVSKRESADYTGIVVNLLQNGVWHILEARRMKLNPTELVDEIFHLARKYGSNLMKIGIEDIMYTSAIDYDITRRMQETGQWFTVEKVRHKNRTKESRIRALVPLFERGNIKLETGRTSDLEDELVHFPVGEHDDILDALAYQLDVVNPMQHNSLSEEKKLARIIMPVFPNYG